MFDLGTAVGYLMLDTSNFQQGLKQANGYLATFSDSTATLQDKVTAMGGAMKKSGSILTTSLTLPIIGLGAAAVNTGNDFEAQMSRVKAIAGATGDEFEQLRDLALQLGADTSFSASQAAEGMENLASAGFTSSEIIAAMPGLLDLAASSGADLGTATEIAASAIRGFGLDASDATHVADVFAEASARTNAQVEDMGEAMKYIAPVANAMGQSLEDTAAAVGIMSDAGIKGSQAGTTLRGALSRLAKPTKDMDVVMGELGLSFFDAQGQMLPLPGIIEQLEVGMDGLTQEQRNYALVTLFGQESLSGMLALMERGSDDLSEMSQSFAEADGAAKAMADTMLDNTSGSLEAMFGSIETLGIKIQEVLAPVVQSVAEGITNVVNAISAMDDDMIALIVTIAGVVAAIGPLLLIGGNILSFMATVGPMLAASGTSLAALLGPIALVIGGVAALALAWATDFAGIRETTSSVMNAILSVVQFVLGAIMAVWNADLLGIQTIVTNAWNLIYGAFELAFTLIKDIADVFIAAFTGDWEGLWEAVKKLVDDYWKGILNLLGSFLDLIIKAILAIGIDLAGAFTWVWNQGWEAAKFVWGNLWSWWCRVVEDPVGTLLSIGTAMFEAGKSILNSVWDGMKEIWEDLKSWVSDTIDWLIDKISFWKDTKEDLEDEKDNAQSRSSDDPDGYHASGLDYVPRNGYQAVLHEGEAVLTKAENQARKYSSGNTFVFYSNEAINEVKAAQEFKRVQKELALNM